MITNKIIPIGLSLSNGLLPPILDSTRCAQNTRYVGLLSKKLLSSSPHISRSNPAEPQTYQCFAEHSDASYQLNVLPIETDRFDPTFQATTFFVSID